MASHHDQEDLEEVSEEVFARRAQARQRQITIGKSRPEYKLYSSAVPFHRRLETMPQTPDPHARISKRAFDRELACWRRGLHVCSSHIEGGSSPKANDGGDLAADCGPRHDERHKWAEYPTHDWSPATESTRASPDKYSEAASSPTRPHPQAYTNVKLNLFEHLSPPVPPQSLPAATSGSAPAMQPMLPAMAAPGAWEMFPGGYQMPGAGSPTSAGMLQFTSAEQQQCPFAMPYAWGGDLSPMASMAAWPQGQQTMPQAQPLVALAPQAQAAPQMPPIEASVGAVEAQSAQQLMWQSATTQHPAPGTPRGSKNQVEESPSTPLNRVGLRSVASPAMPSSPWCAQLRTPSPDQGPYGMNSMTQFKAAQQPPALNLAQADEWAGTTLMVCTQNYYAESEAYMSVTLGTQLRAMIDNPHCGDAACAFPTYVYCQGAAVKGWVPQQLLWRCYIDDSGRRWACDDSTGAWCWVDEMEKNAGLGGA